MGGKHEGKQERQDRERSKLNWKKELRIKDQKTVGMRRDTGKEGTEERLEKEEEKGKNGMVNKEKESRAEKRSLG